ncbi:cytochrome P450 4F22-like [Argonauta hians]
MAMFVLLTVTMVVLWLFYKLPSILRDCHTIRHRMQAAAPFHCLPKHWFFGNLPQLKSSDDVLRIAMLMQRNHHRSYCQWYTRFLPEIVILHPDILKPVINSNSSKPKKFIGYNFVLPWLGDGLILSEGRKWAHNRKMLTPAFHFDILKTNVSVFNSSVDKLIKQLEVPSQSCEVVNVMDFVTRLALNILLQSSLSCSEEEIGTELFNIYVNAVEELCQLVIKRTCNVAHYIEWIYRLSDNGKRFFKLCNLVHEFSENIIRTRRKSLEQNPDLAKQKRKVDFLDIMLLARDSNGIGLSDLSIRNEVDTFMFAGYDTTSCSMSWMLYSMAAHPEHQHKVYQEIKDVLQGRDYVTWNDVPNLRYLTACLKESIRLYTTVPFITRTLNKPAEVDGHLLPVGSLVSINIYAIHHDATIWPKPFEYMPERFLEISSQQTSYNYIPFSAGPR